MGSFKTQNNPSVCTSNISGIPSKKLKMVNGESTVQFDVANAHPNEFNSVSIRPEAEGVRFYPAEYFIGPVNPNELFTIEFNAVADSLSDAKRVIFEPVNMTLSASYGNGINKNEKHESIVSNMYMQPIEITQEGSPSVVIPGLILVVIIGAGMLIYKKKKQSKK